MKRVVIERQRLGMSQAKLARVADVNQSCMSRIENGKEPPYPIRGKRIADALGWKGDPAELFEDVTENDLAAV